MTLEFTAALGTWITPAILVALVPLFVGSARRLEGRLNRRMDGLEGRIDDLRTELKGDIGDLRTELKGELGSGIGGLDGRLGDLRTELKGDIGGLGAELKGDIGDLRTELKGELGGRIDRLENRLNERMDRFENRLAAVEHGLAQDGRAARRIARGRRRPPRRGVAADMPSRSGGALVAGPNGELPRTGSGLAALRG